ncbi:hypothetical protein KIW84_024589 [Lathyrus oleraceus]|uniref:Aminotransferase-like plant mobile domain-containing protein n=1 Tax=Pisum sativum TaxID=3888 RepID=A0A9D5BCH2_PEA|nr:hypothetical protein KIW84_024589 [Pisum sativum]
MLTPTLFDVTTITGLCPYEDDFDPTDLDKDTIDFDGTRAGFTKYIADHHVDDNPEVTMEERIAFLGLWLSRCVFCCKSLKVAKRYLTLAKHMHEWRNVNLGQLILGSLYTALGESTEALRNINPQDKFLLVGPFWILQLWLNATFETSLKI